MKMVMMRKFIVIITAYFSYEVLFNGLFSWLKDDNEFSTIYVLIN